MLEPRPHWTNYAFEGHPIPVARLLAFRDFAMAYLRRAWRRLRAR